NTTIFKCRNTYLNFFEKKLNQYAFANKTRSFEGFPEYTQTPASSLLFNGIHLIVALVSSFIFSSVSFVPSQCAEINPPLFSKTDLNSSKLFTSVICESLKSNAFLNNDFCISPNKFPTTSIKASMGTTSFVNVSRLAISTVPFAKSLGPIAIRKGTPCNSYWANFAPGRCVSLLSYLTDIFLLLKSFKIPLTTSSIACNSSSPL